MTVGEFGKSGAPLTKPPILTARLTRSRSPPQADFRCAMMLSAHQRAAFCPRGCCSPAPSLP